jgi:hypothetical protein
LEVGKRFAGGVVRGVGSEMICAPYNLHDNLQGYQAINNIAIKGESWRIGDGEEDGMKQRSKTRKMK